MADDLQERAEGDAEDLESTEDLDQDEELPSGDQLPRSVAEKARRQAAKYRTERNELKTFVDGLGGKEYVERLITATRTTEGVAQIFKEAGRAFGISDEVLAKLLSGESVVPATKPQEGSDDDDDDDTPLTKAELRKLKKELQDEIQKPLSQQRTADLAAQGARVIHQTLEELGADTDTDKRRVMRYVSDFMPEAGSPDEFDPVILAEAVRKGHEAFEKDFEAASKGYLSKKRQAAGAPGGLGNAGAEAPTFKIPKEPRNSKEASEALEKWVRSQERGA